MKVCACGHNITVHWVDAGGCQKCECHVYTRACICGHEWHKHDEEGCMVCGCAGTRHRGEL